MGEAAPGMFEGYLSISPCYVINNNIGEGGCAPENLDGYLSISPFYVNDMRVGDGAPLGA